MSESITINFNQPTPLFPLPGCVLLPHGLMPLHVFETRYRQMTREVLDSNGLIAMALFKDEPTRDEYLHGRPQLREHACLGYVERYDPLEDGRYLILLRGLCRVRIVREVGNGAYRRAMLEPTEWPPAPDAQLPEERRGLQVALDDPALSSLEQVPYLRKLFEERVPTVGLIDLLIGSMEDDTEKRYQMLMETDAHRRADWMMRKLKRLRSSTRKA